MAFNPKEKKALYNEVDLIKSVVYKQVLGLSGAQTSETPKKISQ